MTNLTIFTLAVLTILATPGPTNTLLMTSGAIAGVYRSLPLLVGELVAGYNIAIVTIGVVLGPLISAAPHVRVVLRTLAAAYLVFVAARLWRRTQPEISKATISARVVFVTTLLNPKALIFGLIVLVIPLREPDAVVYLLIFSVFVVVVGSAWLLVGAIVGQSVRGSGVIIVSKAAAVFLTVFAAILVASLFSVDVMEPVIPTLPTPRGAVGMAEGIRARREEAARLNQVCGVVVHSHRITTRRQLDPAVSDPLVIGPYRADLKRVQSQARWSESSARRTDSTHTS